MIYNVIVDIMRAPLVSDDYGEKRDWRDPVRVASLPASFQPVRTDESVIDRETTNTRWKVYLKPIDIESSDRMVVDAVWYEVDGKPMLWGFSPLDHLKVFVRKVER